MTVRRTLVYFAAALLGTAVMAAALAPAPQAVKLTVAIAMIAAHVLGYAWMFVSMVGAWRRAYGDDEAGLAVVRHRAGITMSLMVATPLVLTAANPWGFPISSVVGWGVMFGVHLVFTKVTLIFGLITQARGRTRPEAPPA